MGASKAPPVVFVIQHSLLISVRMHSKCYSSCPVCVCVWGGLCVWLHAILAVHAITCKTKNTIMISIKFGAIIQAFFLKMSALKDFYLHTCIYLGKDSHFVLMCNLRARSNTVCVVAAFNHWVIHTICINLAKHSPNTLV